MMLFSYLYFLAITNIAFIVISFRRISKNVKAGDIYFRKFIFLLLEEVEFFVF